MTVLAARGILGAQAPRIRVVPRRSRDHPQLGEVETAVERLWPEFDEWQWDVLRTGLSRTRDLSRWAAFTVAVCAPRQNGKNVILEAREVIGPAVLGEKLLIHTAHLADTSKEGFRRLDQLVDEDDWLAEQVKHIWRANGHETIEFRTGGRIRFRTRTRGGGRGFSGSPVFFDEPMFLPEVSMKAILPVISAQPDPQVWYTGSAVDQLEHEDGVVFARVRDRALSGEHERLAYWEWSLEYRTPDEVPEEVAASPVAWAATNPALGVRIHEDYVEAEIRELDARGFAVERLGVGDWPPVDGTAQSMIPIGRWRELLDPLSQPEGQVVFAFDVSPARTNSAIAVAGKRADGLYHVEVARYDVGTGWLAPELQRLQAEYRPAAIVCDGVGPVASIASEVEQAGVRVTKFTTQQHGQACGLLFDAVEQRAVRHLGNPELDSAIRGAGTRPLLDAWAWSRGHSRADICPLVAATLAFGQVALRPARQVYVGMARR